MQFHLKNAPGTFSRIIYIILFSVKWKFEIVYLDDIVILLRTPRKHINPTRLVLGLSMEASIKIKIKKWAFFTNEINYLGSIIRPGRLEVSNHTTDAIRALKIPTRQTGLRSFIPSRNEIRWIVLDCVPIPSPLIATLRKSQAKDLERLNEEELIALQTLQKKLISYPLLALARKERRYGLDADAVDRQIRCAVTSARGQHRHTNWGLVKEI